MRVQWRIRRRIRRGQQKWLRRNRCLQCNRCLWIPFIWLWIISFLFIISYFISLERSDDEFSSWSTQSRLFTVKLYNHNLDFTHKHARWRNTIYNESNFQLLWDEQMYIQHNKKRSEDYISYNHQDKKMLQSSQMFSTLIWQNPLKLVHQTVNKFLFIIF